MSAPERPVFPASARADLHGLEHAGDAQLVVFMAGNQFMAMSRLMEAFRERHPEIERVFYETLPPGLELKQILAGGAVFEGREITGSPDVYTAVSASAMESLREAGRVDEWSVYLHNRLSIMVPAGNPAGIKSVEDLGRDGVRVSQPGTMEDISFYIESMYRRAGGEALVRRILEEKRAMGTTCFTIVHHRETPLRLSLGTADAGPVWATEVLNAKEAGQNVSGVDVPEDLDMRDEVSYCAAVLRDAPNPEAGRKFAGFLLSPEAREIFAGYGFVPHGG